MEGATASRELEQESLKQSTNSSEPSGITEVVLEDKIKVSKASAGRRILKTIDAGERATVTIWSDAHTPLSSTRTVLSPNGITVKDLQMMMV